MDQLKKRAERFGVKDANEDVKKLIRAEKFGTKSGASDISSEDKLHKRASRFGTASDSAATKTAESDVKRMERAKRFGLPDEVVSKTDKDVRQEKRKQRFGEMPSSDTTTPETKQVKVTKTADDVEIEAKKKKRAERFGLVNPPIGPTSGLINAPAVK